MNPRPCLLGCARCAAFAGPMLFLVVGCGKAPSRAPSEPVPISGKVTLDGQPLADAQVTFTTATLANFTGATDSAGNYKLAAAVGGERVCEGPCVATVSKWELPPGVTPEPGISPMMQGGMEVVPRQYRDREQSVLRPKVTAEGGTFDFELKSK